MFNRNDLTLTLFYASSTSDEGSKVAMFTVQVINTDMVAVQSNTLQCITDKSGKKGYSVGEQTISDGSDPLLIALENYWRVKWFTEFGHLNRGDMLTSEQHRCHNEKKKFQRRV